jgi:hypothetical protein
MMAVEKREGGGTVAPPPLIRNTNAGIITYYKVHDAGNYTPDVRHK